ncbi:MAG: hypothetical protein MUC77_11065 [Chromatiaceae bacterium]|jgi:hypothetical protein|nr:hypothetical protein [Chromatiaceae bacterium]
MARNKRWTIIGALVLVLAVLFLRGGDEPDERPTADTRPAPAAEVRPETRPAPPSEERARDWYYGYYGPPGYAPPGPAQPRPGDGRDRGRSAESFGAPPSAGPSWQASEPERYRFRPLDERERARMEAATPIPDYGLPYYSTPERPREDRGREPHRWDPYPAEPYPQQSYPGWQREGYGYRAPERGGATRPDRGLGWEPGADYGNTWSLPPESPSWRPSPAWDLPPAGRMYPSLPTESERRFSVR